MTEIHCAKNSLFVVTMLIITDVVMSETLRIYDQSFLLFPQNVVDFGGKLSASVYAINIFLLQCCGL